MCVTSGEGEHSNKVLQMTIEGEATGEAKVNRAAEVVGESVRDQRGEGEHVFERWDERCAGEEEEDEEREKEEMMRKRKR